MSGAWQPYNNTAPLTNTYTLYATISPFERDNTPLYIDSMLDWETHETLLDYLPNNFRSLFRFILATSLRNLKIIKHLEGGQFASVWQVTFTDPQNKPTTMALRLVNPDKEKNGVKGKFFQISKDRFSEESLAFIPKGPYILSSYYAIV